MASLQLKECGKIFLSTDLRLYALDCFYCNQLFTQWEQFIVHVKDKHHKLDTEDIVKSSKTHKDEVYLIDLGIEKVDKDETSQHKIFVEKSVEKSPEEFKEQNILQTNSNESTVGDEYLDVEYIMDDECAAINTNLSVEENLLNSETSTEILAQENSTQNTQQLKSASIITFETASNSVMLDFIEGLRYFECLWNINSKDYSNNEERQAALKTLSEMLDMEVEAVQNSISYLRNWYKERRKLSEHKSYSSSMSNEQLIEYIKLCEFLNPRLKRGNFKCPFCDKVFSLKKYLDVHKQRHQKELPFQCHKCPKRAATSTEIVTHLRVHTGEKPYKCQFCGETFKTSSSLCVHERKHGEPTIQCSLCPKAFYTNYQLRNHINMHLNVRNYKCNSCEKRFTTAKALYSHNANVHWKKEGERNSKKKICTDVA